MCRLHAWRGGTRNTPQPLSFGRGVSSALRERGEPGSIVVECSTRTDANHTWAVVAIGDETVAGVGTLQEQLGVAAWFCWAVPLLVTEAVLQGRKILAAG